MYIRRAKRVSLFSILFLLALALWLAAGSAAAKDRDRKGFPPSQTAWGDAADLGNGEVKTFVTLTRKGKPKFVGVYFDAAALSGLPEGESDGTWDVVDPDTGEIVWHCCGHETILQFCAPIATPQAMPEAGYYPTEYCIRYVGSEDAYAVTLESFQWFEASDGILE